MKRLVYIFSLIVFAVTANLYAGNAGKLIGQVLDKRTGEPLPGVNVVIQNAYLGAATDLAGEYYILNIPPGTYVVELSYVGYQTTLVSDVVVQSDQTTVLNYQLQEQTMELDEQIVVVADRPLVQKDLTSSKKVTTAAEISTLPVESYAGIMLTQAGVTQGASGELHIRGGRSDEIAYLVDGVSVANPYSTNGLATSVATNAIQEMTVVSGAFNAEYGNAMSGVVNFTTKDGSDEFHTFLTFYGGDYISSHDDIFFNIGDVSPMANKNVEGTLSGPLSFLGKNNTFFVSARWDKSEGYYYGQREHTPLDSANFELKSRTITYKDDDEKNVTETIYYEDWYIETNGDNAIVPMNPSEQLNLLAKAKIQITPTITLRMQSMMEDVTSKSYVHDYKYNPDGASNYYRTAYSNSVQLTHTLSPSTFYELRGGYNSNAYKAYLYEDPTDPRYAPTNLVKGDPGSPTFAFSGTSMGHSYEDSKTYQGKFDITSQISKRHLLKAGVEGRVHELDSRSFTIQYDRNTYFEPTVPDESTNLNDAYVRYPQMLSGYLQDKAEFEEVIINMGLRYDYFYSDAEYAVDPLHPEGEKKTAKAKHMVSPRLGISFPITSEGIIHFSYGHFYQMPSLRNLYTNPEFEVPISGVFVYGNANLNPQRTVTYEMGLQQQFTDDIALDVTAFYKDIRDYLAWQTIQFRADNGDLRTYRVRQNQDYANVKGLTVSLNKRMSSSLPVAMKIDYTFQAADGNDNNPSAFFYNSLSGMENEKKIIPLDWDQSHNLYGSVTIAPADGWTISMIGKLSTGYPYTPIIANSNYDAEVNSSRKPTQKTVDLFTSYRFEVGGVGYQLFAKVYNLFDTLNERFVYDDTGRAT